MRVGSVCYATEQGLGYLAKAFYDNGVVDEVLISHHRSRPTQRDWFPGAAELYRTPYRGLAVDQFLERVDVVLFYETPFDWSLIDLCRLRGVRTALMTMYEWTPRSMTYEPDLILCPSLLDKQYFPRGHYLPVPVDPSGWEQREMATRFLHNGGNLGCREHKGTRQLIQAVQYVRNRDVRFTFRAQDTEGFKSILSDERWIYDDPRVEVWMGPVPYRDLFKGHDVFIMAEKFNGLSLPLQEARAAGMTVMTSDRFPMNTWLPREYLFPVEKCQKACVGRGYLEFDEALLDPRKIAVKIDEITGSNISADSSRAREWAEENSWANLKTKYLEVLSG